ncbi:chorismate mutase [Amycolatopsis sp. NPDC059027]|uniref:chorismate mutase n=1 Tax=unclassified Amycolatopsis TaxID=2618356 RepID=UPI00367064AD
MSGSDGEALTSAATVSAGTGGLIQLSAAAARQEIDNIDIGIVNLLRIRFDISKRIQQARLDSGGARTDPRREADIKRVYRSFFGEPGEEVADAVLRLCRS